MVRFYTVTSLRQSLETYCKRETYGYSNCKSDICHFFKEKDIDVIFSLPILLAPSDVCRLIKSRIENSNFTKGKSSGYRLYFYADKDKESVYLLGFYPKTGKFGKEDLTNTELKILIKQFAQEKADNKLIEHDINDGLKEKPKHPHSSAIVASNNLESERKKPS